MYWPVFHVIKINLFLSLAALPNTLLPCIAAIFVVVVHVVVVVYRGQFSSWISAYSKLQC